MDAPESEFLVLHEVFSEAADFWMDDKSFKGSLEVRQHAFRRSDIVAGDVVEDFFEVLLRSRRKDVAGHSSLLLISTAFQSSSKVGDGLRPGNLFATIKLVQTDLDSPSKRFDLLVAEAITLDEKSQGVSYHLAGRVIHSILDLFTDQPLEFRGERYVHNTAPKIQGNVSFNRPLNYTLDNNIWQLLLYLAHGMGGVSHFELFLRAPNPTPTPNTSRARQYLKPRAFFRAGDLAPGGHPA